MKFFKKLTTSETLSILVYTNKFELSRLDDELNYVPYLSTTPFSSKRLVIGNFTEAEKFLKESIKLFHSEKPPIFTPSYFIQQLDYTDGGLSEVEHRILREVAFGAGAKKAVVGPCEKLTAVEIREFINNA